MGKQYHYIVVYNEDDGSFKIDYQSSVWGSQGHSVYDTNTNNWHSSLDGKDTLFVDEHLQTVLETMLEKINKREAL
jgi:hypothetical protein